MGASNSQIETLEPQESQMKNLAYKIAVLPELSEPCRGRKHLRESTDLCAACGEDLFGPDADACSWQAWGSF